MGLIEIILIGMGLAMDCFAVSVSCGLACRKISRMLVLRMALFFGFFQAAMPLAGGALGSTFESLVSKFDHWIAFSLLGIIGIKMIAESFRNTKNDVFRVDNYLVLTGLSLATSIDALVVGLSFAFLEVNLVLATSVIGVVTVLFTFSGVWIGQKTSAFSGRTSGLIGGLALIAIGTKVLVEHLIKT